VGHVRSTLGQGERGLHRVQVVPDRIGAGALGFPALLGPVGTAAFRLHVALQRGKGGCIGLRPLATGRDGGFQDTDKAADIVPVVTHDVIHVIMGPSLRLIQSGC
jgi:hypothetical protein